MPSFDLQHLTDKVLFYCFSKQREELLLIRKHALRANSVKASIEEVKQIRVVFYSLDHAFMLFFLWHGDAFPADGDGFIAYKEDFFASNISS